ncbi:MAG: hypothetical protein ACE5HD_07570 [Acidobacteriota bacterium]
MLKRIVGATVQEIRHTLPSQRQLNKIEQRLKSLDRRVLRVSRAAGKGMRKGSGKVGRPRVNPLTCSVRSCRSPARAKALCSRHYQQRRRSNMRKSVGK